MIDYILLFALVSFPVMIVAGKVSSLRSELRRLRETCKEQESELCKLRGVFAVEFCLGDRSLKPKPNNEEILPETVGFLEQIFRETEDVARMIEHDRSGGGEVVLYIKLNTGKTLSFPLARLRGAEHPQETGEGVEDVWQCAYCHCTLCGCGMDAPEKVQRKYTYSDFGRSKTFGEWESSS